MHNTLVVGLWFVKGFVSQFQPTRGERGEQQAKRSEALGAGELAGSTQAQPDLFQVS